MNLDGLQERSESSSEDSNCDLAFQLFDGEEMNAQMANFIGIHRLQSLNSPQPESQDFQRTKAAYPSMPFSVKSEELKYIFDGEDDEDEQEEQEQYICPVTGAHFHKADLYRRI